MRAKMLKYRPFLNAACTPKYGESASWGAL
jgi:hypothetical protein